MLDESGLYRLMTWLSPSFPVGAYTYSHGLEWAVETGAVRDRQTLTDWVEGVLLHGAGRSDADLFREAHGAEGAALDRVIEVADALRGTAELAMESANQGRAFLTAVTASWPHPRLEDLATRCRALERPPAYPVAVAVAASAHGVPLAPALTAFLHALAANLVSAAVRLVPLGQTDGQKAQAALADTVHEAAAAALGRDWDDLGAAAPVVDLFSMFHETQYTRLFRS
ncbi:Urease accessory protein UreF [Caenispirillum salinarum AK4]|uniref:Urease accessory protein UreF n=1 Tax=Caenispirillum salinarum AK4 TaxID=1238182 RepID=K9HFQ6_9PROT|nr:urease accessory UreF family protein [Caenispirillum salinarum]EKV27486.1 Urease accessory protein UreF [Caenispirillum salinarum AK4]